MRAIPDPLAAHLATGATTLARCWVLTRADGLVLGFTDHDRDLVLDGVTCRAGTGLEAADAKASFGLGVGGGEVAGALTSDGLDEAEIEAGLYDAARVDVWLVNWTDTGQRLKLAAGTIGEIRRGDHGFSAELRSAASTLAGVQGRRYGAACEADLGDRRCRVDLADPRWRGSGTATAGEGRLRLVASGLDAPAGRFTGGRLVWTAGANAGQGVEVRRHAVEGGVAVLDLWRPTAEPIESGDTFTVTAGCDKRWATCRDTFANTLNYRGFPSIPGNDLVLAYAREGAA